MPHPSDHDIPHRFADGGRDPFASLATSPASRRFWLIELLMAPFEDYDHRASDRLARKNGAAKTGNGRGAISPAARQPFDH